MANLKAADDAFKLANRNQLALLHALDTKKAEDADWGVIPNIEAGTERGPNNEPPLYSREQANALYDLLLDGTEQAEDDRLMLQIYERLVRMLSMITCFRKR